MEQIIKAVIRVPTVTYGYVEISVEGTERDILEASIRLNRLYAELSKEKTGLPERDFTRFIDRMMIEGDGSNHISDYEQMNDRQKLIVNEFKKAFKRIKKQ